MNTSRTIPTRFPKGTSQDGASDAEVLEEMLAASNDAFWCIEFGRPIDLTVSDREIVRQVFENDPYWRLTNPAMARLYRLEAGVDFNSRHPSEIFPRSPRNEDYVLNLIANGFEVDAAPAVDRRYDGTEMYVENDARAHIRDGLLLRMFGLVRDVGKHRHREEGMRHLVEDYEDIFSALPQGVLATDAAGRVSYLNPAGERLLGVTAIEARGRLLATLSGDEAGVAPLIRTALVGGAPKEVDCGGLRWQIAPRSGKGVVATVTPLAEGEG